MKRKNKRNQLTMPTEADERVDLIVSSEGYGMTIRINITSPNFNSTEELLDWKKEMEERIKELVG